MATYLYVILLYSFPLYISLMCKHVNVCGLLYLIYLGLYIVSLLTIHDRIISDGITLQFGMTGSMQYIGSTLLMPFSSFFSYIFRPFLAGTVSEVAYVAWLGKPSKTKILQCFDIVKL